MTDMQLRPALIGHPAALVPQSRPPREPRTVSRAEGGDAGRNDTGGRPAGHEDRASARRLFDPPQLTGPPPAFEVNLLDQRLDIEETALSGSQAGARESGAPA